MLGLRCYLGFSLVVVSAGYFLVVVCGLLPAVCGLLPGVCGLHPTMCGLLSVVASLVEVSGLQGTDSTVLRYTHMACGIFPDQGSVLFLLRWQAKFSTTEPQGKPHLKFFKWQCCADFCCSTM